MPLLWCAVFLLGAALHAQDPGPADLVTTRFRVFDGIDEVSNATRLRVMPAGQRAEASEYGPEHLTVELEPGVFDVQAMYTVPGGEVRIGWAERLVILRYPDEGPYHLEVINLKPGFGALQLRAATGAIARYDVALFEAGERTTPVAEPIHSEGYVLFVVMAGHYDVRVREIEGAGAGVTRWMANIEVPAERTRLRLVDELN